MKFIGRSIGVGFLTALASGGVRAEFSYGLEAGAGYSDNIARVSANERDEKIGTVGLDLSWDEQTRRIDGNALIDLAYFEYFDDTFDSELVGTGDASLTFGIVPERFTWSFQDSFGQAQSDPFAPLTPETREDLNYFTTGPDIIARLGTAGALRLFGRYSLTSYEESLLDSERRIAGAAFERDLSASSRVALNGVTGEVDFDDAPGDYDIDNAFISYELDAARTDIIFELGYTWLKPEVGEETDGPLASLSLIRALSASSTLHVELGTQFTDASEALRSGLEGGIVGGADVSASPDPFENRTAGLRWSFSRNRTGFTLGASWNEDRYERTTTLDRTRLAYEATFSRQLGATLDLLLVGLFSDEEFDTTGLTAEELNLSARLDWQAGRTLGLALSIERYDRDTSDGTGEYVENRAFLLLTFRPGGGPQGTLGSP